MKEVIRAGGGLVFRFSSAGQPEVLVVHRPRYDDWSLPKGKNDPGETSRAAAVREVWEETGYRCRVIGPVGRREYATGGGWKQVDYYAMAPRSHTGFQPGSEVDEVRWIPVSDTRLLTYAFDQRLVEDADYPTLSATRTLFLVRHAAAGSRQRWTEPDHARPLTPKGRRQSHALAERLAGEGIERLVSSPYVRCVQTLEPLSEVLGIPVEEHPALGEGGGGTETLKLLEELSVCNAALSSHGDVIPSTIFRLAEGGMELQDSIYHCRKGSTWVISMVDGVAASARYEPPPEV
ncbi:MAG: NUDIX hydrolase [Acidimicrobiia bacterium]|nr:NUDIX hydrolase [bacterium]MXX01896.1 NUDIX hydrolase [Acidimicrobiia bacterium]MDE0674256.1 NUDIX hydrolase [bacterium]MXX45878.1 NUDIX hydrolase [Acidimicrobiia bacterium]MXY74573.1 NUDIX hydrolase [Acidimicrobiia bacterium]